MNFLLFFQSLKGDNLCKRVLNSLIPKRKLLNLDVFSVNNTYWKLGSIEEILIRSKKPLTRLQIAMGSCFIAFGRLWNSFVRYEASGYGAVHKFVIRYWSSSVSRRKWSKAARVCLSDARNRRQFRPLERSQYLMRACFIPWRIFSLKRKICI